MRPFAHVYEENGRQYMCEKILTPENITKEEMRNLASIVSGYADEFFPTMIIPKKMYKHNKEKIKEGMKKTKELIENLDKGKRDKLFKQEWEY